MQPGMAVMGAPVLGQNLQPYQYQPQNNFDPQSGIPRDGQVRGYTLYDPSVSNHGGVVGDKKLDDDDVDDF